MDDRERLHCIEILETLREEIIEQQRYFTSPALVGVERAIKATMEKLCDGRQ